MKSLIEWLEAENSRLRKVLAIAIFLVWFISTFISFFVDILAEYTIVTGQLAIVIGFYMASKPKD